MKRAAAITIVLLVASVAYAARCSTGQQLYSDWRWLVEDCQIMEQDILWMWAQFELAGEEVAQANYAVSLHMGFHGCDKPGECSVLADLLVNVAEKQVAADCAFDACMQAQTTLDVTEEARDEAEEDWLGHRYTCPNCD